MAAIATGCLLVLISPSFKDRSASTLPVTLFLLHQLRPSLSLSAFFTQSDLRPPCAPHRLLPALFFSSRHPVCHGHLLLSLLQDLVGACTQSEADGSMYGGNFTSSRLVFYTFSHRPSAQREGPRFDPSSILTLYVYY